MTNKANQDVDSDNNVAAAPETKQNPPDSEPKKLSAAQAKSAISNPHSEATKSNKQLAEQASRTNKSKPKVQASNHHQGASVSGSKKGAGKRMVGVGSDNSDSAQRELLSASQCSNSQASTSFISSSCFLSGDATPRSSSPSSSTELAKSQTEITEETEEQSVDIGQQQQHHHHHHQATNLLESRKLHGTATSRSMLNLDQTLRGNEKFQVVWQNLSFSYGRSFVAGNILAPLRLRSCQKPPESPPVLRDISGHIKSNELVAIIGPSGCGKTTLLQFLAGNRASQQNRMRIVGLDEPKVAFIGQDDSLLPGLTASETLIYASRLQNSRPNFDHQAHIQPILNELGLDECAHRDVQKLSGGQMKRVTIAQELLYPTNLLILDEVTSGLDASTSYSIVKLLKYLVSDSSYPMSIVMSIHQPSARLFSVFDRVYVMSEGFCLYEGGCQVEEINKYLGQFNLGCPQFHNIADYLIEIACCTQSSQDDILSLSNDTLNCYEDSVLGGGEEKLSNNNSNNNTGIYGMKQKMVEFQRKQNQDLLANAIRDHQDLCATTFSLDEQAVVLNGKKPISRKPLVEGHFHQNKEANIIMSQHQQEQSVSLLMNKDDGNYLSSLETNSSEDRYNGSSGSSSSPSFDHSLYAAIERSRNLRQRPFMSQFLVHFARSSLRIRRSVVLTYLQLMTYILLGLQLATFYGPEIGSISGCPRMPVNLMHFILSSSSAVSDPDTDQEQELANHEMRRIQENMNFLLVAVLLATFAALEMTVITFPLEAKTVKREWRNGWYRVTSYFLGRTLADLPFTLVFVTIFALLVYSLTGQIGLFTWRFLAFLSVILMTALVAQTYGFIFGALFMDNLPAAVFVAPLALFPSLLFSGFFSRVSQVPALYKPMTVISHFRYIFDSLLLSLYGYNRCECEQPTLDSYHANLRNQTDTMRDMFQLMFGAIGCNEPSSSATSAASMGEPAGAFLAPVEDNMISHEEVAAIQASNSSLAKLLAETTSLAGVGTTTTMAPTLLSTASLSSLSSSATNDLLVNAIVDNLFDQMSSNSTNAGPMPAELAAATNGTEFATTTTTGHNDFLEEMRGMTAMDRLSYKFSLRITQMLSKQSNFGHPMPRDCNQYNSYLLQEFGLNDQDLMHDLLMLALFVLFSRLVCNLILNFTIATRAR